MANGNGTTPIVPPAQPDFASQFGAPVDAPASFASEFGSPIDGPATVTPPPPVTNTSTGITHSLDALEDVGKGIAKGAGQTVNTISGLLNKIPVIGETLAPKQGISAAETIENPTNTAQKIGIGIETIGEFMLGDEALKGLSLGTKLMHAGKMAEAIEQFPRLKKALEIGMTAIRGGTVAGADSMLHGASPSDALATGATAAVAGGAAGLATEGVAGAARTVKSALSGAGPEVPGAVEAAVGATPAPVAIGAPEAASAGETQQTAAARIRQEQGAEVGAAKEAARPEGFSMELNPFNDLSTKLQAIDDKIGNDIAGQTEGLKSLKDPELDNVRGVVKDLTEETKNLSNQEIDKIRDQLKAKIDQQKAAFKQGNASGTALKYYQDIKKAFDDEMYSQVASPNAAERLQSANKTYAQTVEAQTKGPAKKLFRATTPEKIIKTINTSQVDGTTMSAFLKDKTPAEVDSLRNGVLRDLKERATSHGEVDYEKAWNQFDKQRDAGRVLYGDKFHEVETGLRENAAYQNLKGIIEKNTSDGVKDWKGALKDFEAQPNGKALHGNADYNLIRTDLATKAARQAKIAAREELMSKAKEMAVKGAVVGITGGVSGGAGYKIWKLLSGD